MIKMSIDVERADGSGYCAEIAPLDLVFVAAMNDKGELKVSNQYGLQCQDPDEIMISLAQAVKNWTGYLAKKKTAEARLEKNLDFLKEFSRLLVINAAGDEWIDNMDEDLKDEA